MGIFEIRGMQTCPTILNSKRNSRYEIPLIEGNFVTARFTRIVKYWAVFLIEVCDWTIWLWNEIFHLFPFCSASQCKWSLLPSDRSCWERGVWCARDGGSERTPVLRLSRSRCWVLGSPGGGQSGTAMVVWARGPGGGGKERVPHCRLLVFTGGARLRLQLGSTDAPGQASWCQKALDVGEGCPGYHFCRSAFLVPASSQTGCELLL